MSHDRVLVVEDEPTIAEALEYSLESEGFSVRLAGTGGDGLAEISHREPDFVILDIGLPDMSGFDVCREIRKTSTVPVLFLTARENEIDRVVGLEIGADDYVVKPFSPRELVARVRAILRRSRNAIQTEQAGGGTVEFGDLKVDNERMQARCGEKQLNLSRYELGLLKVFLEHPGRVYTRDQLMEQVWDEPEASLDRTVDAHIKSLRAKLREANPDLDAIVTHRGIGYSLREDL
ncbi:MAG: two-component system response regulator CreB [Verrucomicrobiales bacterium]|nr:two-component system response regulator CreB [Verrucomicrobiales bacterium]